MSDNKETVNITAATVPPITRPLPNAGGKKLAWYHILALSDELQQDAKQLMIRLPSIHIDYVPCNGTNNELVILSNEPPSSTILLDHIPLGDFRKVHYFSNNQIAMISHARRDSEPMHDPRTMQAYSDFTTPGLGIHFDMQKSLQEMVWDWLNPDAVKAREDDAERLTKLVTHKTLVMSGSKPDAKQKSTGHENNVRHIPEGFFDSVVEEKHL